MARGLPKGCIRGSVKTGAPGRNSLPITPSWPSRPVVNYVDLLAHILSASSASRQVFSPEKLGEDARAHWKATRVELRGRHSGVGIPAKLLHSCRSLGYVAVAVRRAIDRVVRAAVERYPHVSAVPAAHRAAPRAESVPDLRVALVTAFRRRGTRGCELDSRRKELLPPVERARGVPVAPAAKHLGYSVVALPLLAAATSSLSESVWKIIGPGESPGLQGYLKIRTKYGQILGLATISLGGSLVDDPGT